MTVAKTNAHVSLAKVIANSVKSKPNRAAAIIERALLLASKKNNGIFDADTDKEMREHVSIMGEILGADKDIPDFAQQVAKVKAPPKATYKAITGKYGKVAANLVEDFVNAETNVTPEKIQDACNRAAAKQADSGVKVLDTHKTYTAELKITGASKRLYSRAKPSSGRYTFTELGKHT